MRGILVGTMLVGLSLTPVLAQEASSSAAGASSAWSSMQPAPGGDARAGQAVFNKCKACHDIGENAKNRMGPVLTGVVGRVAGTAPDYKYSAAMTAAGQSGLTWTPETLEPFLTSPKDYVKGTKMPFALTKPEDRANVIAYLLTFSPDYVPAGASSAASSAASDVPSSAAAPSSSAQ